MKVHDNMISCKCVTLTLVTYMCLLHAISNLLALPNSSSHMKWNNKVQLAQTISKHLPRIMVQPHMFDSILAIHTYCFSARKAHSEAHLSDLGWQALSLDFPLGCQMPHTHTQTVTSVKPVLSHFIHHSQNELLKHLHLRRRSEPCQLEGTHLATLPSWKGLIGDSGRSPQKGESWQDDKGHPHLALQDVCSCC